MTAVSDDTGLRRFMDQGGLWPLLAFLVGYFAIYLGAGFVFGQVGGQLPVEDDLVDPHVITSHQPPGPVNRAWTGPIGIVSIRRGLVESAIGDDSRHGRPRGHGWLHHDSCG